MPRKDTYVSPKKPPPVRLEDQHRRSIGRQNVKIGRREMRAQKKRADAKKSAMSMQEVALMLLAFLAVVVCVYFFLYAYLNKSETVIPEKFEEGPAGQSAET